MLQHLSGKKHTENVARLPAHQRAQREERDKHMIERLGGRTTGAVKFNVRGRIIHRRQFEGQRIEDDGGGYDEDDGLWWPQQQEPDEEEEKEERERKRAKGEEETKRKKDTEAELDKIGEEIGPVRIQETFVTNLKKRLCPGAGDNGSLTEITMDVCMAVTDIRAAAVCGVNAIGSFPRGTHLASEELVSDVVVSIREWPLMTVALLEAIKDGVLGHERVRNLGKRQLRAEIDRSRFRVLFRTQDERLTVCVIPAWVPSPSSVGSGTTRNTEEEAAAERATKIGRAAVRHSKWMTSKSPSPAVNEAVTACSVMIKAMRRIYPRPWSLIEPWAIELIVTDAAERIGKGESQPSTSAAAAQVLGLLEAFMERVSSPGPIADPSVEQGTGGEPAIDLLGELTTAQRAEVEAAAKAIIEGLHFGIWSPQIGL